MKKPVLFAIAALALLASCAKTEVVPVQNDGDQLISFQTAVSRQGTRALIDGAVYPTTETFGTFAFFNAKGTTFPTGAELYIPESEVKYRTNDEHYNWYTATPYYWPKQGSLTFFSYSPYNALSAVTGCSAADGITISEWDVDLNQGVDILVADYKTNQTKNISNAVTSYNGVPTVFRHKLSQIVKIAFMTDEDYNGDRTEANAQVGDKFFYVNSVKINKIQHKGGYKSGNNVGETNLGAWTPTTDVIDCYTWYEDMTVGTYFDATAVATDPTTKLTNNYLLVLPQGFTETDGKTIQITYTIKTCTDADMAPTFSTEVVKDVIIPLWQIQGGTATVEATPWNMNQKLSYTFKIGLDQIYWDPAVENWEEDEAPFAHTIE